MEREAFVWLGLLIVFLVVEIITVGLTSVWLAGGALAALLLNIAGLNLDLAGRRIFRSLILTVVFYPAFCG